MVDPQRVHAVRESMREQLATGLHAESEQAYEAHASLGGYTPDPVSAGRRALANQAPAHLCLAAAQRRDPVWPGRAYQRFKDATNMTDRQGALTALVAAHSPLAEMALSSFHETFRQEPLVIDNRLDVAA